MKQCLILIVLTIIVLVLLVQVVTPPGIFYARAASPDPCQQLKAVAREYVVDGFTAHAVWYAYRNYQKTGILDPQYEVWIKRMVLTYTPYWKNGQFQWQEWDYDWMQRYWRILDALNCEKK